MSSTVLGSSGGATGGISCGGWGVLMACGVSDPDRNKYTIIYYNTTIVDDGLFFNAIPFALLCS